MSKIDEWKKENEEKKKYLEENFDSDYWYEHLAVEKELFPSTSNYPEYLY